MTPPTARSPRIGGADVLDLVSDLLEEGRLRPDGLGTRRLLGELVRRGVEVVPGAEWCSITAMRSESLTTLATSHDEALAADQVQYDIGSGPCVDAVVEDHVFLTRRVHEDARWPEYGRRVHAEVGVGSVLAQRLTLVDGTDTVAALNIYSTREDAFGAESLRQALLLATQCSLLVAAYLAHGRSENLLRALDSNREIGVAVGVLMARHRVTREEAFAMLRVASQAANRKIRDLASEVADTGDLP
ncbi:GAF and ANTAR domain-containing protein [Phycicoccus sp. DTK01]|uniref:GAF and ANTAR domain-containing protein n=1 Tax=Phycicoccus sp. DTK01 TaxID=2785745 RepID=UPI001A8FB02E|nr:GAF and ANTAR domain-containing protein [Phycicoccus sp. DTK01]GIL37236.1 transcriptional regulator [Phycicoccus sp. DTK01]